MIEIIEQADTFGEVNQVEILVDKVIMILEELGLTDKDRVCKS